VTERTSCTTKPRNLPWKSGTGLVISFFIRIRITLIFSRSAHGAQPLRSSPVFVPAWAQERLGYGWAFGLPENFGSGISGIKNFGFSKLLPEICMKKEEPNNLGTQKFGFGFGYPRTTREFVRCFLNLYHLCRNKKRN